jgi:hypothetical protein
VADFETAQISRRRFGGRRVYIGVYEQTNYNERRYIS